MTPPPPDEVTLRGMRFHALVGVLPHERVFPQPLEIDVTAWVRAGEVMDYRGLYASVAAAVRDDEPLEYLERIGEGVAARVLADGRVLRVRVALRKPSVALPGPLAHAEIVIVRDRSAGPEA